MGARENLQSLQTKNTQQAIAGAAKSVQDEISKGNKQLAIWLRKPKLEAITRKPIPLNQRTPPVFSNVSTTTPLESIRLNIYRKYQHARKSMPSARSKTSSKKQKVY